MPLWSRPLIFVRLLLEVLVRRRLVIGGLPMLEGQPGQPTTSARLTVQPSKTVTDEIALNGAVRFGAEDPKAECAKKNVCELDHICASGVARPSQTNDPALLWTECSFVGPVEEELNAIEHSIARE
jgi:hypothetical protein